MPCCKNYWARQEVDAAGRVGSTLQKILFFLCALTAVSVLSCDPMVMAGAGMSLVVYAVGIHGAQKRQHRALFFYGAVSLVSLLLTAIAFAFIAGFLLFGGAGRSLRNQQHNNVMGEFRHHHDDTSGGMVSDVRDHAHSTILDLMHKTGVVEQPKIADLTFPNKPKIVDLVFPNKIADLTFPNKVQPIPIDASVPVVKPTAEDNAPIIINGDKQPEEIDASIPVAMNGGDVDEKPIDSSIPVVVNHLPSGKLPLYTKLPNQQPRHKKHHEKSSSDAGSDVSEQPEEQPQQPSEHRVITQVRVTPFGYAVIALGSIIGILMLVLKIKSIRLAFQMRRMLLAQATSLPVRQPTVQLATPPTTTTTTSTTGVHPPAGPAPSTRRDCSRCTYVNAANAARCAMCDSPLAIVANAAPAPVPRVYVPGSLYPLNAPLN